MTAYVDAHTHLSNLTVENLQMMKLAGVETVVSPVQLGCEGMLHTDTNHRYLAFPADAAVPAGPERADPALRYAGDQHGCAAAGCGSAAL